MTSSHAGVLVERVRTRGVRDQLAVVDATTSLTYAELDERAGVLAAHLRGLGVVEGALVGVCLPRSVDLVVASLAVLQAGAAYVALDPAQPAQRLASLVADAGVALVVAQAAAGLGSPDGHGVVRVAEEARTEAPGLAYVMYTSGSTGAPKGVLVEQDGVDNLAGWHARAFDVRRGTRCSQLAGVGFDAAAWELWGTLCAGGTLVVPPESVKTDPGALRDWLVEERIEVAFAPTPLAEAVVALHWPAEAPLRRLLTGGDRLHAAPPAGLPFTLVNNYGVTEASVVTTSVDVPPGVEGLPPIGPAIDGVDLRVVDASLTDAAEGELLVGGVSVARGYLGAPELTAERFVTLDDRRWYRTGDRVRIGADGTVAFAGRSDDQVQVRGSRVEPAEIEAVLTRHAGVTAAAVRPVDERLVAWVVGLEDVDEHDLRTHLGQWLPAHMVPDLFVAVPGLPVTANGKVDVAALPRPGVEHREVETPQDELTSAVAAVVAEMLAVDAVAADENFLLLGGHSLLGAQLVIRLSEQYGVELALRDLFDDPTPAGIAERVRELVIAQIIAEQPA